MQRLWKLIFNNHNRNRPECNTAGWVTSEGISSPQTLDWPRERRWESNQGLNFALKLFMLSSLLFSLLVCTINCNTLRAFQVRLSETVAPIFKWLSRVGPCIKLIKQYEVKHTETSRQNTGEGFVKKMCLKVSFEYVNVVTVSLATVQSHSGKRRKSMIHVGAWETREAWETAHSYNITNVTNW